MSNNPYLAWPLWHYFTMNSQNIDALMNDDASPEEGDNDLVAVRGIVNPILINEDAVSLVATTGTDSADSLSSIKGGKVLATLSNEVVLYDFMKDKVVRMSRLEGPTYIYMANTYQKIVKKPVSGSHVVLKGGKSTNLPNGGDILPFVGEPKHMNLLIQLIAALATGVTYDIRANLSLEEISSVDSLLQRPIYNSASIKRILDSYKTCGTTRNEDVNLVNNIGKKLAIISSGKGQPGRSINIERGAFSNSKHDKTILEFKVKLRQDGQFINVKFSFPQNIPSSKKEYYVDLLRKNFFAEQVHTPSLDERRSTEFKPITIESTAISSIFGEPDKFSSYVEKINMLEKNKSLDTSATLTSLPSRTVEDDEEEEEDDEDFEED